MTVMTLYQVFQHSNTAKLPYAYSLGIRIRIWYAMSFPCHERRLNGEMKTTKIEVTANVARL